MPVRIAFFRLVHFDGNFLCDLHVGATILMNGGISGVEENTALLIELIGRHCHRVVGWNKLVACRSVTLVAAAVAVLVAFIAVTCAVRSIASFKQGFVYESFILLLGRLRVNELVEDPLVSEIDEVSFANTALKDMGTAINSGNSYLLGYT